MLGLSLLRAVFRATPLISGTMTALLGAAVLIGWQTQSTFWTRVRPWLTAMEPIAALGFLLSGVGLVALQYGRKRFSLPLALTVLFFSLLMLWQYLFPDDSPLHLFEIGRRPFPGRLPPNTAIAFGLLAAGLIVVRRSAFTGALLGVGVVALGAVALLGYAVDVTQAFRWGRYTRMAIHSSLGFTIIGTGLVAYAFLRESATRLSRSWWRPVLVGSVAALAGLLFSEALRSQNRHNIRLLSDATSQGIRRQMETGTEAIVISLTRLAGHGKAVGWSSPVDWQEDARVTVGAFRGFEMIEWIDADFVPRIVAAMDAVPSRLAETDENAQLREEALELSRRSGLPVVVGPFAFEDGATAFRVIIPLAAPHHPEAFLSGVFNADLALSGLSSHLSYGYSLTILCQGKEIFRDGDDRFDSEDRWLRRDSIDVPGPVPWEAIIQPKRELLAALVTPLPELALVVSFLIALLLTLTVHFGDVAARRARRLEDAVKDRTLELEQSMKDLRIEVTERRRTEDALRRTQTLGRVVSAELNLEKVVQAVTDAATELTRAEFGALAYELTRETGLTETRIATSGPLMNTITVEDFPDTTVLLEPILRTEGVVRIPDVRVNPEYRRNLPEVDPSRRAKEIRSYMAVPVASRSGRIWGGLLFGHTEPAAFLDRDEEMAVSLAAQATIAMDNASLYEAERRASAEAKATSEAKDNFIHMLGHELRNPLGSVRTALQVLSATDEKRGDAGRTPDDSRSNGDSDAGTDPDSPSGEPAEESVDLQMRRIIDRQVDQFARLVDDLLEISQIASSKLTLRPEPVELNRLVVEVVESMRTELEAAGIDFTLERPSEPLHVRADSHRMRQVMANLLTNARKFTDAGGTVRILLKRDKEKDQAVLLVKDSGCGIDPDDLERVFEPFVQTELARNRKTGGLGLGLPIVKGLIEAQGGIVNVFSEGRDRGSEVVLRLPLLQSPPEVAKEDVHPERTTPRRILVIDDHRDSADSLKRLLAIAGNEVEVAYRGQTGIELARRFRPDVLICDIGLPGMDGFQVARELGKHPVTSGIHLIALTGFGDEDTIHAAREAGFTHHMTKPLDTNRLMMMLAAVPVRPARG